MPLYTDEDVGIAGATPAPTTTELSDEEVGVAPKERSWFEKQKVSPATVGKAFMAGLQSGAGALAEGVATAGELAGATTGAGMVTQGAKLIAGKPVDVVPPLFTKRPAQVIQQIAENPVFRAGEAVVQDVPSRWPIPEQDREALLAKGAEMAGSFVPLIASGPAAPATIGLQSLGSHISTDFADGLSKGLDPETAARNTILKAMASGATQATIFAVLPKPLRSTIDKWFIDKLGVEGAKRFLAGRAANVLEGFALGTASVAGENVVTGKPVTQDLAAGGIGMAAPMVFFPRGKTQWEVDREPLRAQRRAMLSGFYDEENQPQLPPPPEAPPVIFRPPPPVPPVIPPPIIQPERKAENAAFNAGIESIGREPEHIGTPQRPNLPENAPQVREETRPSPISSNRPERSGLEPEAQAARQSPGLMPESAKPIDWRKELDDTIARLKSQIAEKAELEGAIGQVRQPLVDESFKRTLAAFDAVLKEPDPIKKLELERIARDVDANAVKFYSKEQKSAVFQKLTRAEQDTQSAWEKMNQDAVPDDASAVLLRSRKDPRRYRIAALSTYPDQQGKWQVSDFDERGATGHFNANTLRDAISTLSGNWVEGIGSPWGSVGDFTVERVMRKTKGGDFNVQEERLQGSQEVANVPAAGSVASQPLTVRTATEGQGVEASPSRSNETQTGVEMTVGGVVPRSAAELAKLLTRAKTIEAKAKAQYQLKKDQGNKTVNAELRFKWRNAKLRVSELRNQLAAQKRIEQGPKEVTIKAERTADVGGERPPDIIDDFRGSIGRKLSLESAKQFIEDIEARLKAYPVLRKIFTRQGGMAMDDALDSFHREGMHLRITSETDFVEALISAAADRKGAKGKAFEKTKGETAEEAKRIDFEEAAFQARPTSVEQGIPVSTLYVGDKFQLRGADCVVKDFILDPETGEVAWVEIEDGRRFGTQKIANTDEAYIFPDKGTLEKKEPTVEDTWNVEEEPAPKITPLSTEEVSNRIQYMLSSESMKPSEEGYYSGINIYTDKTGNIVSIGNLAGAPEGTVNSTLYFNQTKGRFEWDKSVWGNKDQINEIKRQIEAAYKAPAAAPAEQPPLESVPAGGAAKAPEPARPSGNVDLFGNPIEEVKPTAPAVPEAPAAQQGGLGLDLGPAKPTVERRPLTPKEQDEFQTLAIILKKYREGTGEKPTSEQARRYEQLSALAGQETLGFAAQTGKDALRAELNSLVIQLAEMEAKPPRGRGQRYERWSADKWDIERRIRNIRSKLTEGQGEIIFKTEPVERASGYFGVREFRVRQLTYKELTERYPDPGQRMRGIERVGETPFVAETRLVEYEDAAATKLQDAGDWYIDGWGKTKEEAISEARDTARRDWDKVPKELPKPVEAPKPAPSSGAALTGGSGGLADVQRIFSNLPPAEPTQAPSGKWYFGGGVAPLVLRFERVDGEPITREQATYIQQFGISGDKRFQTRTWDSKEQALAAQAELRGEKPPLPKVEPIAQVGEMVLLPNGQKSEVTATLPNGALEIWDKRWGTRIVQYEGGIKRIDEPAPVRPDAITRSDKYFAEHETKQGIESPQAVKLRQEIGNAIDDRLRLGDMEEIGRAYVALKRGDATVEQFNNLLHERERMLSLTLRSIEEPPKLEAPPIIEKPAGAPIGTKVYRSGYTWEKRADGWYALANANGPGEIKILPERQGWLEKQLTKPDKDVRVDVPKQAKVEAPKPVFEGNAPEGAKVGNYQKKNGRWYRVDEEGNLGKIPTNKKQHDQLEADFLAPPKVEETRPPLEVLNKAKYVSVKLPEGATVLRGYFAKGRKADLFITDANKGINTFQGAEPERLEAGFINRKGEFTPIKGDIVVKERKPKEMAAPRQSEEGALAAIDQRGNEYEREVAAKWRSLPEQTKQAVRDFVAYEESMEQKYGRLEWGRGSGSWHTGKDPAKAAIRRRENTVERQVNAQVPEFGGTAITFARGRRNPDMSGRFVNFWEPRESDLPEYGKDYKEPDRILTEAKGPQAVIEALNDPRIQWPEPEKELLREFFRRPTIQKLTGLRSQIAEAVQSAFVGDYEPMKRLSRFTNAQSGIHETLHDLWYSMSPEDRMEYIQLRQREIAAALKDLPRNYKEIAALEKLAQEPMSSEDFINQNLPRGLYYLANEREFFVASNESRFLRDILTPEAKGLVAKTKALIQEVWDWLKTLVGKGDRRDALYKKILKGDYELSPEEGARLEAKEIEGALPRTPEEYKKQKAFDEENVAGRTVGAYAGPARMKMALADEFGLSPGARRILQLQRESEMYSMGASEAKGIEDYYQAREAAPADKPHLRFGVVSDAVHNIAWEEQLARDITDRYQKAQAFVDSPSFQKKIAREAELAMRENIATAKEDTFRNVIAQKVAVLEAQLRTDTSDSARIATLREDLRLARGLMDYTMAIGQQMDNIVNRVYPEFTRFGRAGYWTRFRENATGPKNGNEFLNLYLRARRAEGNPLENTQEMALARLAAEILGINFDLTNRLLWSERWRREPDFQQAVKDIGATFVKRLREDPAAAIKWMVEREGKLATKAEQAKAAYQSINRDVMRELEKLGDLEQAATVMKRMRESDEWKKLVNTVFEDVDGLHLPDVVAKAIKDGKYASMFNEFTGRMIKVDPKGNWHDIDLEWTPENAVKSQAKLDKYLGEIQDWLNDPANENSPDRKYWQEQNDWLYSTYKTASVFAPRNVKSLLIHTALRMPEFWFKQAKLPAAKVAQTAAENWERSFDFGKQWSAGVEQPVIRLAQIAARKHGVDVSLGLQAYRELIFNSLAWKYRHGIEVKPGDKLFGVTVLPEDINLLKAMGRAVNDLVTRTKNLGRERVMERERLIDDYFKNAFLIRSPQEFGALPGTTVPREFSSRAKMLARRIVGETITDDGKRITKPMALDDAMKVLNWESYFEPFVMRWLGERSADYSKETPYETLFKEIVKLHNEKSPDAPRTVEEIIDYIDRNTDEATTKVDIKNTVVGGMVEELTSFYDRFLKDDAAKAMTIRVLRASSQGPFNKAFLRDIGSSFYYDYGMMSGQEVRSMALDAGMYHLERFEIALNDLMRVYDRAMLEFDETKGNPEARALLKSKNKELFHSGDDFRDFSVLRDQRAELKYFIDNLPIWTGKGVAQYEGMQTMYRLVGDSVLSTLAGWKTLARVLSGSVVKQGFVFGAFERFYYTAYLKAALSMAMSALQIGVKGPAMFAARRLGLAPKVDKEFSGWAEEIFRNGKYFDQQYAYGLGTKTPVLDTVYNNLVMPYTHGRGYDPRLSGNAGMRLLQKGAYKALAAMEAPLEVIKTIFPTLGYSIAYDSVARQMYWSIKKIEAQARRSFEAHEQTGTLSKFDLNNPRSVKNVLPADEILPRGLFPKTQTHLDLVAEYFKRGTDADINDFVMEFWKKLSQTPKDQRKNVHLLSADAKTPEEAAKLEQDRAGALAAIGLFDIHHASPMNRMWALRASTVGRLAFPIAGWTLQSTRQWFALFGTAAHDPQRRRALLTAMTAMTMLAGMSAMAVGGDMEKRMFEKLEWILNKTVDPVRHFGQGRTPKENAIIAFHDVIAYITVLANLFDQVLGEKGNRVSAVDQIYVYAKLKSLAQYISGVIHTKDPYYGLNSFLVREAPSLKPLVKRLPSNEGITNLGNVRTAIKRYAPEELLRQQEGGYGMPTPTALSPIKQRLLNAIYKGDSEGVALEYDNLKNKAIEIGRTEPLRLAADIMRSLNPYTLALIGHPTEAQRQELLSKLNEHERQIVLDGESMYLAAAQLAGVQSQMTRQDRGLGVSGSTIGYAPSSGSTGVPVRGGGSAMAVGSVGGGGGASPYSLGGGGGGGIPRRISLGIGAPRMGSRRIGGISAGSSRVRGSKLRTAKRRFTYGRLKGRSGKIGRAGLRTRLAVMPRRRISLHV